MAAQLMILDKSCAERASEVSRVFLPPSGMDVGGKLKKLKSFNSCSRAVLFKGLQ